MVIETLEVAASRSTIRTTRSRCSTTTPTTKTLWRPVEAWCKRERGEVRAPQGLARDTSRGRSTTRCEHMVEDSCELIGVIDSDYQIEPHFLRRLRSAVRRREGGLHPSAQDYRDWESAPFYRRLYYSYQLLLRGLPAVPERARRRHLRWHDGADPAPRARAGRRMGRVVHHRGRRAVAADPAQRMVGPARRPLVRQGDHAADVRGAEGPTVPLVLRRHPDPAPPLALDASRPGERTRTSLSLGQRWAYLCGGIQWYGDLLALLFFVCLLVGAANIAFSGGLVFRKLTGFLLAAIPLLVVLGLLRAVALLRRGTGASWRDALGAFLIWQSTTLTVTSASLQGLFAKEAAFLRTPKTHGDPRWSDALKANWARVRVRRARAPRDRRARCRGRPGRSAARGAAAVADGELPGGAVQQPERAARGAAAGAERASADRVPAATGRAGSHTPSAASGSPAGPRRSRWGCSFPAPANIVAPQLLGPAKRSPRALRAGARRRAPQPETRARPAARRSQPKTRIATASSAIDHEARPPRRQRPSDDRQRPRSTTPQRLRRRPTSTTTATSATTTTTTTSTTTTTRHDHDDNGTTTTSVDDARAPTTARRRHHVHHAVVRCGAAGLFSVVLALSAAMTACGNTADARRGTRARRRPAAGTRRARPPCDSSTRYVTSDGRVIRHDQGGDIVSEGQAYGMLLAEVAERPALVRTIWSWTSAHLGRSDGLFAWHATGTGRVEDPAAGGRCRCPDRIRAAALHAAPMRRRCTAPGGAWRKPCSRTSPSRCRTARR